MFFFIKLWGDSKNNERFKKKHKTFFWGGWFFCSCGSFCVVSYWWDPSLKSNLICYCVTLECFCVSYFTEFFHDALKRQNILRWHVVLFLFVCLRHWVVWCQLSVVIILERSLLFLIFFCEAGTILSDGLLLSDVKEESCLCKCLHVT